MRRGVLWQIDPTFDPATAEDQVILVESNDLPGGDGRLWDVEGDTGSVVGERLDGGRDGPVLGADLGEAAGRPRGERALPVHACSLEAGPIERGTSTHGHGLRGRLDLHDVAGLADGDPQP